MRKPLPLKVSLARACLALACGLALIVSAAPAQDNVRSPSTAPADGAETLHAVAFEHRQDFGQHVRNLVIKLDAQIAALNRPGTGPENSARAKAIDEAKSARILLENQLGKVDQATSANWPVVRDSVLDALARVQSALARANQN